MNIEVSRVEVNDILPLRELYRQEVNCQIVHDSFPRRGFSDPYLIRVGGRIAGYGLVANKHYPDTVDEFHTLPAYRAAALPMFRQLLEVSQANRIRAQTNDRLMLLMLYDCAANITSEAILFADGFTTHLTCPTGILRKVTEADKAPLDANNLDSGADWMIESGPPGAFWRGSGAPGAFWRGSGAPVASWRGSDSDGGGDGEGDGEGDGVGVAVAAGGILFHYNPPYGDIYMAVHEAYRQRGFGSYLVQELKRICYEMGKTPAARCNVANVASRKTLQKAGLLPCGRILLGDVVK
jgi:GNAT superfamily N-acetyltransferase